MGVKVKNLFLPAKSNEPHLIFRYLTGESDSSEHMRIALAIEEAGRVLDRDRETSFRSDEQ